MATQPTDPLSAESLRSQNTFAGAVGDRISGYARRLGEALLNSGQSGDATAAGLDAYRQHVMQAQANGQQPMPQPQFMQLYQQQQQAQRPQMPASAPQQ